jgi:hypothetical protein
MLQRCSRFKSRLLSRQSPAGETWLRDMRQRLRVMETRLEPEAFHDHLPWLTDAPTPTPTSVTLAVAFLSLLVTGQVVSLLVYTLAVPGNHSRLGPSVTVTLPQPGEGNLHE